MDGSAFSHLPLGWFTILAMIGAAVSIIAALGTIGVAVWWFVGVH